MAGETFLPVRSGQNSGEAPRKSGSRLSRPMAHTALSMVLTSPEWAADAAERLRVKRDVLSPLPTSSWLPARTMTWTSRTVTTRHSRSSGRTRWGGRVARCRRAGRRRARRAVFAKVERDLALVRCGEDSSEFDERKAQFLTALQRGDDDLEGRNLRKSPSAAPRFGARRGDWLVRPSNGCGSDDSSD
jgi:hypothetical protein